MRKINETQPLPKKKRPSPPPPPQGAKHPITVGRDLRQHLDGTNQTLKVGHANQSGVTLSGASKVLTNQICDANGDNCLNIHDLGNLDVEGNH